jgi:hypothetical protein
LLFYLQQRLVVPKMTSVSLEVLLWPQAPLSSVLVTWHTKWCFIFPIKVTKFS